MVCSKLLDKDTIMSGRLLHSDSSVTDSYASGGVLFGNGSTSATMVSIFTIRAVHGDTFILEYTKIDESKPIM